MILRSLRLQSFRAHEETRVTFAPKVNLVHGPNGAGKTNLLEAVHYLCLSKSFLAARDKYALRKGASHFELEGAFEGEQRSELEVRLAYVPGEGKRMFVNGAPLERLSEIVGRVPVVVFSQQDQALTAEGPSERRRFTNKLLSQAHPTYMEDLLKYRKALRQRNALLKQHRGRPPAPHRDEVLASWDEEITVLGSRIIARRIEFLRSFSSYLEDAYRHVESVAERPTVEYDTLDEVPRDATPDDAEDAFRQALRRTSEDERERGRTLIGPQLRDRLEETPLFLLDDIFDNFDRERSEAFLGLLQSDALGQSLITAAQPGLFEAFVPFDGDAHRKQRLGAGAVLGKAQAV
ncbi:MAG: DNA replication and repair protein RecF [Bacteroidetes bacterium QS_8_64_10]|nr:MAG: DNA replication and repair protein RecF [Bacteroidetes bacterium QS_8_64_10]